MITRFEQVPGQEGDAALKELGFEGEVGLVFVHQLADTTSETFGPIAVVTFEAASTTWSDLVAWRQQLGDETLSQSIADAAETNSRKALSDAYLGMSQVSIFEDSRSLSWSVDYLEEAGTLYNQIYWRTWTTDGSLIVQTIFYVAAERIPLYRGDMTTFLASIIELVESA